MKKRRIVIASILKPVDDTRMLEKMAMTLDASNDYEVSVIGYPSKNKPAQTTIRFFTLPRFNRLTMQRLMAPWKVLGIVRQVKPDILIVNTHDLLIVAVLAKLSWGCRIVYDVRENYLRTVMYGGVYPPVLRECLAVWVRLKEMAVSPFFDHFFLAEAGYRKEMNFFRSRATVLANKATLAPALKRSPTPPALRLLFSGTMAESTGVFQAIALAQSLHGYNQNIRLLLVGYCAIPSTLQKVRETIQDLTFAELRGGDQLVPHADIARAIHESDFGIIYYPPSPHIENSIPTKLYEYLAASLPILLQPVPAWLGLASPPNACIPVDFLNVHPAELLNAMEGPFYTRPAENVSWASEAPQLLAALDKIIV